MSTKDGKKSTPGIDADAIRELSQLLNETGLTEIEIEREGARIRVSRAAMAAVATPTAAPAPAASATAPVASGPHPGAVPSPMVGTVYLSPAPGQPAFVALGQQVNTGDTLCIIEAMKTMNNIQAPHAGKVLEISVRDSEPVEFGQPLFVIG